MGSLSSEALPEIYSKALGLDVLSAEAMRAWEPPEQVDTLRLDFLVPRGWLPLAIQDDGTWLLATRAPFDLEVNEWLGDSKFAYRVTLISEEAFGALRTRLGRYADAPGLISLDSVEEGKLRELASEAPTVNLLNALLARALRQGASDMHVEPLGGAARVRYRIDGVLHEVETIPTAMVLPVITRLKILAGMDIGERRRPQDGKIELRLAGEDIDIRASILPLAEGESAVLRFLRRTALVYDMKELGLSRRTSSVWCSRIWP